MMKKLSFAAGIAILILTLAACGDGFDGSGHINAQRPGAPRNVTAEISPCGNWALVSWLAGNNAAGHQVVRNQADNNLNEVIMPVNLVVFVDPLNRADWMWDGAGNPENFTSTNRATFSWNADSSLSMTANAVSDRHSAIVPLYLNNALLAGNYRIGVRASGPFDQAWADVTHSTVTWAGGGARPFSVVVDVDYIAFTTAGNFTGAVGTEINLNTLTAPRVVPSEATLQAIRWEVQTQVWDDGWQGRWVNIPAPGGVFTPRFRGQYRARAIIPHAETSGWLINIDVTGTPFVPLISINIAQWEAAQPAVGATVNTNNVQFNPPHATKTHSDAAWSSRTDSVIRNVEGLVFTPVTGTTISIPTIAQVAARAFVEYGSWWSQMRIGGDASTLARALTDAPHFLQTFIWNPTGIPTLAGVAGFGWSGNMGFEPSSIDPVFNEQVDGVNPTVATLVLAAPHGTANVNMASLEARPLAAPATSREISIYRQVHDGSGMVWVPVDGRAFQVHRTDLGGGNSFQIRLSAADGHSTTITVNVVATP